MVEGRTWHREKLECINCSFAWWGYWVVVTFLRYRMICLPCLFCQQRDNQISYCFSRSSVAWEKASSLGTNTTPVNRQVVIPLIVGKSLNPFRRVLCNHCPLRRMAFLLGLPACSTGWWLNLLQEFCIVTLPLVILYILLIVLHTQIIFSIFWV